MFAKIFKFFIVCTVLILVGCSKSEQSQTASIQISTTQSEQELFVTNFYRDYLSNKINSDKAEDILYSRRIKELLKRDHEFCKKIESRESGICGYDADGDFILATQMTGEGLNFENSQFIAKQISTDIVEIKFNLEARAKSESFDRTMQIALTKEDGTWKAHDIFYKNEKGSFDSFQKGITDDFENLEQNYANLDSVLFYLKQAIKRSSLDEIKKWFSPQIVICDQGECSVSPTKLELVENRFKELNTIYFMKENDEWIEKKNPFDSKPTIETPSEHQQVELNGFTFEFIDQLWYITKIDLDKIQ